MDPHCALRLVTLNYLMLGWAVDGISMPRLLAAAAAAAQRSTEIAPNFDTAANESAATGTRPSCNWAAVAPTVTTVMPFTGPAAADAACATKSTKSP